MRVSLFFIVNAAIVFYLILKLLALRRPAQPNGLRMQRGEKPTTQAQTQAFTQAPQEKSLNCWFQFNGHTWDAFEALGVPAGSNRDVCLKARDEVLKKTPASEDFLRAAWSALEQKFSSES